MIDSYVYAYSGRDRNCSLIPTLLFLPQNLGKGNGELYRKIEPCYNYSQIGLMHTKLLSVCIRKAISRMPVASHALHRRGRQRNPMLIRSGHTFMKVCIETSMQVERRNKLAGLLDP